MQGEHEDARDDCSCHSSMLARGPERRGARMKSAGLAAWLFSVCKGKEEVSG